MYIIEKTYDDARALKKYRVGPEGLKMDSDQFPYR